VSLYVELQFSICAVSRFNRLCRYVGFTRCHLSQNRTRNECEILQVCILLLETKG